MRIKALDALRGIAAFSVMIGHCLITFPMFWNGHAPQYLMYGPLHLIWDGHEAVILFFILSGFVLSLPFVNGQKPKYRYFLVKRIFRIYIPYVVAVSIASLLLIVHLHITYQPQTPLSNWFYGLWTKFDWKVAAALVFMLGGSQVDTTTWSLIHEMRISLVFPVLVWISLRFKSKYVWVFGLLIALLSSPLYDMHIIRYVAQTVYYAAFFIFGVLLAKDREQIIDYVKKLSRKMKYTSFLIAVIFFYNWSWTIPQTSFLHRLVPIADLMVSVGAMVLIIAVLSSLRAQRILEKPALLWLGKVSYSLYLIHPIILLSVVYFGRNLLPEPAEVAFVPILSLVGAKWFYKWIEQPSIRLGSTIISNSPFFNVKKDKYYRVYDSKKLQNN